MKKRVVSMDGVGAGSVDGMGVAGVGVGSAGGGVDGVGRCGGTDDGEHRPAFDCSTGDRNGKGTNRWHDLRYAGQLTRNRTGHSGRRVASEARGRRNATKRYG